MTRQRTRGRHPSEGLRTAHDCRSYGIVAERGDDLTVWMCTRCPATWTRRTWKPKGARP